MSVNSTSQIVCEEPAARLLARRAEKIATRAAAGDHHDVIAFGSGHASPALLPDLRQAADLALSTYRPETLQYGPRPGTLELREWLSAYLAADGVAASPSEINIVNGAKNGLDLICRILLDEGDAIVVTAPTYFTAIPIFRSYGVDFIEIGQDAEGFDVDELSAILKRRAREGQRKPKFIYNVPEFHNPTGKIMSTKRRQALIDLAVGNGILVIEDSPYRSIRFEGTTLPSLKSMDPGGWVLGLGSFAKLMAPGLRVGWVVAPEPFVGRLTHLKADGGTCPLTQRIILEFCKAGELVRHTERLRTAYRGHRDAMLAAIRRHLPQASTEVPLGGYYVWITLPAHADGDKLAAAAAKEGVDFLPGSKFYAGFGNAYPRNQGSPQNHIRLAFSEATPDEIEEGLKRIGKAYRSVFG